MHNVNNATAIQFINGKCYIRNGKAVKLLYPVIMHAFHVTCYQWPQGRTHTHTDAQTKTISRNQVRLAFGCACLVYKKLWACLGIEPRTSCTQSRNHTTRPTSQFTHATTNMASIISLTYTMCQCNWRGI